MILLNESSDSLSLSDRQTIALFEEVSDLFKTDSTTIDLMTDQIAKSGFDSLPSDIVKEPSALKKLAAIIVNGLDVKYKMRYRTYRRLSNDINNLYVKTQNTLKSKISERSAHASDPVGVNTYNTYVMVDKKRYKFQYAELYINYNYALDQITNIIEYADPKQHANEFAKLKKTVVDYIYGRAWFVQKAKFETIETFHKVDMDAAINYSKESFDNYFAMLHKGSVIVENELLYIGMFNKTYDEVVRRFDGKVSKEDKKAIDDIFFEIVKALNDVINWNQVAYEELLSTYHKFFDQIQKLYDKIK